MISPVAPPGADVKGRQPNPPVEEAGSLPRGGTEKHIWQFPLRNVDRAMPAAHPAGHHTRPWLLPGDGELHVVAHPRCGLPVANSEDRSW